MKRVSSVSRGDDCQPSRRCGYAIGHFWAFIIESKRSQFSSTPTFHAWKQEFDDLDSFDSNAPGNILEVRMRYADNIRTADQPVEHERPIARNP